MFFKKKSFSSCEIYSPFQKGLNIPIVLSKKKKKSFWKFLFS